MTPHDARLIPFRIDVPEADLADLRDRLRRTRFPAPLPGDGWDTGVPVEVLRDHAARWATHDWRATEERLNARTQYLTDIDGQQIHVVHVPSRHEGATPLLLLHGWPGSFLEFEKVIDLLVDTFDVVIPSLPGFGFSTPLSDAGWGVDRIARVMLELMTRVGHETFVVQGGDVGAGVAPEIARLAPDRVRGVHVNGALGAFAGELDDDTAARMTPIEVDRMRRVGEFMQNEFGYIAVQSTRPGLVGAMAADSPVGQLAWMLDKLQAWSHPAEVAATDVLGEEFVLANATLWWLTASAGSAAYVGYAQEQGWGAVPESSGVPTAAIQFAHDIGLRHLAEQSNTIVRWTDVDDRGGHFAALEEPELLVDDVRAFVAELEGGSPAVTPR
ncbi:epoxide hydrolase family protein [Aeromicrobium sp. Leaf350]|uniref:epoxide hydrolase family protein n=1 Tax=Aeromicrobium sp. Leaf350 TaxID=2876565 RepID=UPI001E552A1F|nr:epoxide hydrolase [Aeromicrobium sp. Leaf350]